MPILENFVACHFGDFETTVEFNRIIIPGKADASNKRHPVLEIGVSSF
jgi:hypothetical protein